MRLKEEEKINPGIYKITNLYNKRVYVGESFDIEKRWDQHKNDLLAGTHDNLQLQADFNRYGKSYYKFEVLQFCDTDKPVIVQARLIILEDAWIKYFQENNINLYNAENSLEKILLNQKRLQVAPSVARNILIFQLIKFKPVYENNKFILLERNTVRKELMQYIEQKCIPKKSVGDLTRKIENNIKSKHLSNKMYVPYDFKFVANDGKETCIDIRELTNHGREYVGKYIEIDFKKEI